MIAQDKLMHFLIGTLLAIMTVSYLGVWSLLVVFIAGVGKEVYDKVSGKGTPELMDIAWTMYGGLVIVGAYLLGST